MGTRKPEDIRSIALISHGGAGKTTLNEAFLFDAGLISRMGRVEDKNTVSDFDSEEQKRGISISTSLSTIPYKNKTLYILDTPGFADFVGEQRCAMRVADGALVLVNATAGVEVQTQSVWDFAETFETPAIFFVSKLDRENTDFDNVVADIQENISDRAVPLYLPIGSQLNFKGVVNVLTGKSYMYNGDGSKDYTEGEVPADMADTVAAARETLIERAVEADDELMMRYLDGEELSTDELLGVLRKAVCARSVFPIIPGSGTANIAVPQLMDMIVEYMPSPKDMLNRAALKGEEGVNIPPDENGTFLAFVFKVMVDPYVGKLTYLRVYSGTLAAGSYVVNATKDKKERIGRLLQMHSNQRVDIDECQAGDIVAVVGLKDTTTGDSLCEEGHPIILESMEFADPVIDIAVEPKTKAEQDKMMIALQKLAEEDPTFRVSTNHETGQTIIAGMGELHLEIIIDRLLREFKVEANVGKPQVAYRERPGHEVLNAEGKFVRQSGGRGQYGHAVINMYPQEPGEGYKFENKIVGGVVPKEYIPSIDKGIQEALNSGVLAGYPVEDVRVELIDGSYHEVDSSEAAFKVAGSMAIKDALRKSDAVILEPVMAVEVETPEEYTGFVMGDIPSRRGLIQGQEQRGNAVNISAKVPLSQMFGYATDLRSGTQGRAVYTMQFDSYEPVPKNVAEEIISKAGGSQA